MKDIEWMALDDEPLEGLLVERWVFRGVMLVLMFAAAILTTYLGMGETKTLAQQLLLAALLVIAFAAAAVAFVMRLTDIRIQRELRRRHSPSMKSLDENYRPPPLSPTFHK